MPRKPRRISSIGIYHIILRSANQHIIFEEDADYLHFLSILSTCKMNFDIDIYAYCLMDNHVHMLIHASEDNLSSFFQSFGTRFVRWYNNKYSRSGHLFQDRFHSVTVESDRQYLSTLLYIHNNPVEAAVCRYPSEYRWSSFNAFYGLNDSLVNTSYSYNIAGSKTLLHQYFASNKCPSRNAGSTFSTSGPASENAVREINSSGPVSENTVREINSAEPFSALMRTVSKKDKLLTETSDFSDIHRETKHFIPDTKALEIFKNVTGLSSTSEAVELPKHIRNKYIILLHEKGLTIKQSARLLDISVSTVKRVCSASK